MSFQFFPYLWLLIISFVILLFLAIITFRYRQVKGTRAFALCMLNFAFWVFCNALEMAGTDLSTKLFWANMQYISYTTIHICWLYMILQFTGKKKWLKPGSLLLLLVIPLIIIILVWTDKYHGLIRYGFSLDYGGGFPVIEKSYGPLYWIHPIYGYTINLISIFLILKAVLIHKSIYRMQALALLISPIISIVPSVLYILSLSPVKRFDITPVFLGISGIVAAIGLFRYQLFALVPVARDVAMDNMDIGIIIIDVSGNIVDANPLAAEMLEKKVKSIIGQKGEDVVSALGISVTQLSKQRKDFKVDRGDVEYIYEIQSLPIVNKHDIQAGRIILIRDVTELKKARLKIIKQERQIAIAEERGKMARDLHDNLGQVMGFINLQAQGIQNEFKKAGINIASKEIEKLIEVTRLTQNDIREYIKHTGNLEKSRIDLITAVGETVKDFEKQTGIKIKFDVLKIPSEKIEKTLNDNQKTNILNIIIETLNNVRKHSGADYVCIKFSIVKGQLTVLVEDNGKGFDEKQYNSEKKDKFGLSIMKSRAEEMGGCLTIDSIPGKGSTVCLSLPVQIGWKYLNCSNSLARKYQTCVIIV